jgi:uncharacterized protein
VGVGGDDGQLAARPEVGVQELAMFPLGTVLFPHMVLPLHIFEPRYRDLITDVLAGDREFGVVLITRGHEVGGHDERADIGTVTRVLQAEELEDGRWLVVTVGVRRVRVVRWLEDRSYPRALVEELPDDLEEAEVRPETVARLRRVLGLHAELGHEGVPATFEIEADPAVACWQVAVVAPLTPFDAQRVLATRGCAERLALLDEVLEGLEDVLRFQLNDGDPSPG